ncbi:TetR/AcrR family transcriptional regulator [Aquabacter spiritensis]|uniref:TetR family transcriptional regulator n=1 Tax=Aquabacter spiritensis TaxID=933073 RepID=A0A4R3LUT0_9HYPH|nr:TetR/AcrR family transcriptional regulator [Aquabacter spiritensis]TCT04303.1 TetR family transcriptional regulator [Aquabacter spiritensis]
MTVPDPATRRKPAPRAKPSGAQSGDAPAGTGKDGRPAGAKPAVREVVTRDADKTRMRILEAAQAEFARKGLAGARVDLVAEEAGANKRMIYYYFGSKEDLYVAVLERVYTDMRVAEAELELEDLPPVAAITRLVEFKFDYPAAHPHLITLLNGENMLGGEYLRRSTRLREMQISLIERLKAILAQGAQDGSVRSGIDPLHLYMTISAISYFYFSNTPTLSTAFGRDLATPEERAIRRRHVVEVVTRFIAAA